MVTEREVFENRTGHTRCTIPLAEETWSSDTTAGVACSGMESRTTAGVIHKMRKKKVQDIIKAHGFAYSMVSLETILS